MHDARYMPCMESILHDLEEEGKVFHLCQQSEKLGIWAHQHSSWRSSPNKKNLWLCEDCHTSTKFTSQIVGRAIMVRDANRCHHFEDDVCSYMFNVQQCCQMWYC